MQQGSVTRPEAWERKPTAEAVLRRLRRSAAIATLWAERLRQARHVDAFDASRPCSRNWPPAPAIARQKLVGFLRPLATSLIERKPIRSCATPNPPKTASQLE